MFFPLLADPASIVPTDQPPTALDPCHLPLSADPLVSLSRSTNRPDHSSRPQTHSLHLQPAPPGRPRRTRQICYQQEEGLVSREEERGQRFTDLKKEKKSKNGSGLNRPVCCVFVCSCRLSLVRKGRGEEAVTDLVSSSLFSRWRVNSCVASGSGSGTWRIRTTAVLAKRKPSATVLVDPKGCSLQFLVFWDSIVSPPA
ncbi:PREDICTED: uncharacterized protein LOC105123405 isoform X1 [Populus euphratica]|uniref:Uncharacterized protein LOC105123405 isoform X1 n=1 Tax=Populus euphratica TaxID=75702 RepID=A0AAJ6U187_POPEU|nr:PREDICTED: uncharacterized protein LOC105123405 isoform X1 [Populus euphratica]